MARVYLVNHGKLHIAYSIDDSVGTGSANRRDDVLLVQFFLRVISQFDSSYVPAGEGPLNVDGICGTKTQRYIRRYQERNSQLNPENPLKQDGRIDPIRRGGYTGAVSGRPITMLALNFSYQNVRGQIAQDNITRDPQFPQELRPALALS